MAKYHLPKDYMDTARSLETSPEELEFLARNAPYEFILREVAGNPNTPPDVLLSLVPDVLNLFVRHEIAFALAGNPSTPVTALSLLAERLVPFLDNGRGNFMAFRAGIVLCSNPKTPIETIRNVLHPVKVSMQFRKVVARETTRSDVMELLLEDRSEKVRRRALENRNRVRNVEHS
jgi:hypothetical protein